MKFATFSQKKKSTTFPFYDFPIHFKFPNKKIQETEKNAYSGFLGTESIVKT